jgi:retron-type reverse transcriptase
MYNRVVSFLNKYNFISDAQNGFRKKKSTFTAIHTFIDEIQKALDNKRFALGIILDLSKAFDVINHNLLLAKLEPYGIRGKIHVWMSSYLMDRTQFVEIQHVDQKTSNLKTFTSSYKAIKHGVPQGSVLGPLLFLLFINDLPQALHEAKVILFADDTNTLLTDKKLLSLKKILKVRNQLDNWFHENHLIINTEKTKYYSFREEDQLQSVDPFSA